MEHQYNIIYKNLSLRQIKAEDIEQLREWRNDKVMTRFLRPLDYITDEKQKEWFNNYLKDDTIISFCIFENDILKKLIGSVSLYDFNNGVAEIGKIQIGLNEAHGKGFGRLSLLMVCKMGFEFLKLNKIIATVHSDNIPSFKNFEKLGFIITGRHKSSIGGIEYELSVDKKILERNNTEYKDIEIFTL